MSLIDLAYREKFNQLSMCLFYRSLVTFVIGTFMLIDKDTVFSESLIAIPVKFRCKKTFAWSNRIS